MHRTIQETGIGHEPDHPEGCQRRTETAAGECHRESREHLRWGRPGRPGVPFKTGLNQVVRRRPDRRRVKRRPIGHFSLNHHAGSQVSWLRPASAHWHPARRKNPGSSARSPTGSSGRASAASWYSRPSRSASRPRRLRREHHHRGRACPADMSSVHPTLPITPFTTWPTAASSEPKKPRWTTRSSRSPPRPRVVRGPRRNPGW